MEEIAINVAADFNEKLGGRWIRLGPFSGELFYSNILEPKFKEAVEKKVFLNIYLDGTTGYGSSFLDQSFGELARNYGVDLVRKTIVFHTKLFDWNVNYIKEEVWGKK